MTIQLQKTAEQVARKAGMLLLKYAKTDFNTRKKARFDLVTDADIASNELIKKELHKAYPQSLILAEEDGVTAHSVLKKAGDCKVLWIVDPLDGTSNFAKRIPHYAVSIAAYNPQTEEILAACIYDPNKDECFTAARGRGANLNGRPIHVSSVKKLQSAMSATGFSYSRRKGRDNNLAELVPFAEKSLALRRFGAASLDLAWVACARYDIYWESWLSSWDVAAGILIVREAGGLVSDYASNASTPFDDSIVATNAPLHKKALKQLVRARRKAGLL